MAETTTIDPTDGINLILDRLDKPATLHQFFFVLDLAEKMLKECKDAYVCRLLWMTISAVGENPDNFTEEQIESLRDTFKLPKYKIDIQAATAESVETKNTSLYLESFRFQTKL